MFTWNIFSVKDVLTNTFRSTHRKRKYWVECSSPGDQNPWGHPRATPPGPGRARPRKGRCLFKAAARAPPGGGGAESGGRARPRGAAAGRERPGAAPRGGWERSAGDGPEEEEVEAAVNSGQMGS